MMIPHVIGINLFSCYGSLFWRNCPYDRYGAIEYKDADAVIAQMEAYRNANRYNRSDAMRIVLELTNCLYGIPYKYYGCNNISLFSDAENLCLDYATGYDDEALASVKWEVETETGLGRFVCSGVLLEDKPPYAPTKEELLSFVEEKVRGVND